LLTEKAHLSGFEPDDVPGIGTFYDFMKRIVDGPYRKPNNSTVKRSQINARKHLRNLKREKGSSKNHFNTNRRRSEKLVDELLDNSDLPRADDFNKTLEDLLFQAGIIPSVESGLLQSFTKPVISGDGSILETAASSYGKPTCSCRKEGVFQCDHPRSFTSPTAQWCYSQHLNRFVFGDRYYHLVANENEHDFPLLTMMPGGNESDHTLSLKSVDRFIKAAEENGLKVNIYAFCGDGHHDTNAHYRYFIEKQIAPIIPLSRATKAISPHLPDNDDLRLDYDCTPLCPAGVRMRHHMYDKNKRRHVFCCPAKRNTHRQSKTFYVFHKQECPRRQNCRPDSTLAPFVYIKSDTDPRLFPPIPRNSKLFKQLKNQRNASERINFINDSYNVERSCRNADYGLIRLTLANIAHHAVLRYKARQKEKSDDGLSRLRKTPGCLLEYDDLR